MRWRAWIGAAAATLPLPLLAQSRSWPERPVRLVVPFPPGGAIDAMARLLAPPMAAALGKPVLVDNRAGAGGTIGTAAAAQAGDGHTLLMVSIGHVVNPALYGRLPYAADDFAPVAPVAIVPNLLVVSASRPWTLVAALIAAARSRPGMLSYASAGSGTSLHLAGALFADVAQITLEHVPYRGSGPAIADVLAGRVDMMFDSVTSAGPHIAAGRLRALGVTTSRRAVAMPDVPTVSEAGLPGYALEPWFAMLAPRSVPPEARRRAEEAVVAALRDEGLRDRFAAIGAEVTDGDSVGLGALLARETAQWTTIISRLQIRAE